MCSTDSRTDRSQLVSAKLSDSDLCWKKKVSESFGSATGSYEQYAIVQRRVALSLVDWAEERVEFNSIENGLEIGCGTGYLTRELLERHQDVQWTITDVATDMVNHCRNHPFTQPWIKPDTLFEVVDGELLDFGSRDGRQFDIIFSNMTFQWFADLPMALERLMALVRTGGWLFFSIPAPDNFGQVIDRYPCLKERFNDSSDDRQVREVFESIEGVELELASHVTNRPYPGLGKFLRSLKMIGANVVRQPASVSGPGKMSDLREAIKASRKEDQLLADYRTSLYAAHKRAGR